MWRSGRQTVVISPFLLNLSLSLSLSLFLSSSLPLFLSITVRFDCDNTLLFCAAHYSYPSLCIHTSTPAHCLLLSPPAWNEYPTSRIASLNVSTPYLPSVPCRLARDWEEPLEYNNGEWDPERLSVRYSSAVLFFYLDTVANTAIASSGSLATSSWRREKESRFWSIQACR